MNNKWCKRFLQNNDTSVILTTVQSQAQKVFKQKFCWTPLRRTPAKMYTSHIKMETGFLHSWLLLIVSFQKNYESRESGTKKYWKNKVHFWVFSCFNKSFNTPIKSSAFSFIVMVGIRSNMKTSPYCHWEEFSFRFSVHSTADK